MPIPLIPVAVGAVGGAVATLFAGNVARDITGAAIAAALLYFFVIKS